jgi:hypothetical protein
MMGQQGITRDSYIYIILQCGNRVFFAAAPLNLLNLSAGTLI